MKQGAAAGGSGSGVRTASGVGRLARWLLTWEGYLLAFTAGAAACFLTFAVYNQARELHRLGVLERAVRDHAAGRESRALGEAVATARMAMADGRPLAISRYLATDHMVEAFHHQMDFAAALLRAGDIASFNDLRRKFPFVAFSLRGRDLHGLDLSGADLSGMDLRGCPMAGVNLHGAHLERATLSGADLSGSDLTASRFDEADLSGANLSQVHGTGTVFTRAVLADANLSRIGALEGARFDEAVMSQVSMVHSRFPGAHFVHTNLLLASLVGSDLRSIAELDRADLTGANLSGTQLDPRRCSNLWLTGATGLGRATAGALRRRGCLFKPDQVFGLVAPEIVTGFTAQIEENREIPAGQRRSALLSMLKAYSLQ